jgi:hypothetical protein
MELNIICVDLRMYNQQKLKELGDIYDFKTESLINNKQNGFKKIWIDLNTKVVICFTSKMTGDKIVYTDDYENSLLNIKAVEVPKKSKILTVDSILDKINKWGIESLNEQEKNFLKNQS